MYNENLKPLDSETSGFLLEKKIIVEEKKKYDFYHKARLEYLSNIGIVDHLSLCFAPTTGCNFACPYCYEGEKENEVMPSEIVGHIVRYINGFKSVQEIDITWYGGEPLIAFGKMKEILKKIQEECHVKIVSQDIVTNGYCITDEIIDFFNNNNFRGVQISFDGIEERHNSTRFLKGSQSGTFKKIIDNLDKLVNGLSEKTSISLRINIHKDNEDDFAELYHFFMNRYPNRHLFIHPGFIEVPTCNEMRLCYHCFNEDTKYSFYKRMVEKGVNVDFIPTKKEKTCGVHHNNSIIIGPSGEIYKCWNDFNHPEKIVGNIVDNNITNPSLLSQYLYDTIAYSNEQCKNCYVFPVCSGGCSWMQYKNLFENRKYKLCSYLKDPHKLEDCLLSNKNKEVSNNFKINAE